MTAKRIDGKAIAASIREEIAEAVAARVESGKSRPGLATVLVGDDPASHSYVRSKRKACEQVGIESFHHELPADTPQSEVMALVEELNQDERVNGILVQLPLPDGLDEEAVLRLVDVEKDVDGFHPLNLGRLAQKGRDPYFTPCTPAGIIELLKRAGAELSGARAVVLGRSNIVGMPVSLLLVKENATITICHSRTKDLPDIVREADVLVAAIGRPEMVRGDWIKPGAVVIDVGVNRVDDDSRERGYRLVGDVAYDEAMEVAAAVTPVPGGVGPMTITMLLRNTLKAAERSDPS
ncbi:MAG: bifunctional methylenetetrahydrofolate dehydrogenase/methenyltetrahydrofolate cyclohydrolase FolD [Anaerolineales bacterium]